MEWQSVLIEMCKNMLYIERKLSFYFWGGGGREGVEGRGTKRVTASSSSHQKQKLISAEPRCNMCDL